MELRPARPPQEQERVAGRLAEPEGPSFWPTEERRESWPVDLHAELPQPEQVLHGRYQVGSFLGGGGMGLVFAGTDLRSGRQVAIKTTRPGCAQSELLRFIREASLDVPADPALVEPLDRFVEDRRAYQVQDRVPGRSLQDILVARLEGRGPRRPHEAGWFDPTRAGALSVACARELCRAVQRLHDAQVLHRDLKPANLIWSADRQVVLVDFGVARTGLGSTLTPVGHVAGTVGYVAPELWRADSCDRRADVYSLGASLWHLLTGFATVGMPRGGRLWGTQLPVPDPLLAVVQKAMEWSPKHRFQSAAEMGAALAAWETGEAGGLPRPGWPTRLRRSCDAHRGQLGLAAGVLVLLALAAFLI